MRGRAPRAVRLGVVLMRQDDPKKCTAARLERLGLARGLRRAPSGRGAMVLDPYSPDILVRADARSVTSVTAIDCSWRLAVGVFAAGPRAARKALPPLLAGNPVNYARLGTLTTAEALAATLFVLGEGERAHDILSRFAWGHTFHELNASLLDSYARLEDASGVDGVLREHGIKWDPSDAPGAARPGGRPRARARPRRV